MDYSTDDLRTLLSVATRLRHLAADTPADDRALYLAAAAGLEARAGWLATHLPHDRSDAQMHRPVDVLV